MNENRHIPTSLKIVAWLFILVGVTAVIEVAIAFSERHINIHFGLLGLLVGPGLFRLSAIWRLVGMALLTIAMALMPIFLFLMLSGSGPINLTVLGNEVGEAHWIVPVTLATLGFVLSAWQYRVLASREIRKLFHAAKLGRESEIATHE